MLALWAGKNPLNTNERMLMKRKNEGRLPGLDRLPERVRMIVQGLTSVRPETRWSYDEVERWFLGESPAVDIASPYLKYHSFVVDPERNLVADDVAELVSMLMENERLACAYLYSGKITEWLEQCGNTKLSAAINDIVKNLYPADQHAGLMAAVYTMDPSYPYMDMHGNACTDMHSIALAILANINEYASALIDRHDRLWLYAETHAQKCDVNRMWGYVNDAANDGKRRALLRVVYELDRDISFLAKYPSFTLQDIVDSFGRYPLSDDEWESLTDGRLLSWMYNHEDDMACEALRIMTEGQPYSKQLAYKVLYNIDRKAAYDLRDTFTVEDVGKRLCEQLVRWQGLTNAEFAGKISEYSDPDGRFCYYARLHGWMDVAAEAQRCFDMNSAENRERLGAYDLRTAAYRLCRILDTTPQYLLADGDVISDGLNIDNRHRSAIRTEMRSGCFAQWLSVFYHEDPHKDFSEAYSYEHTLEQWLERLGEYDAQTPYYKRFVTAKKETASKYDEVRGGYLHAKTKEGIWKVTFYLLSVTLMLLLAIKGCGVCSSFRANPLLTVGIPVGGLTALIVGMKSFFRGYGTFISLVWGSLGYATSFIPIYILSRTCMRWPSMFVPVAIVLIAVYMAVCHFTMHRGNKEEEYKLIDRMLETDIKSTLIEPLYYTFKTKSYRFKGSKFGLLDDAQDRIYAITSESIMHYVLWSMMAALLVVEMLVLLI